MSAKITSLSLHDVALALANHAISSVKATKACLERMEKLNPVLDSAVEILTNQARSDAHALFDHVDPLHIPVIPISLPTSAKVGNSQSENFFTMTNLLGRCTPPINYLGLPGISVA